MKAHLVRALGAPETLTLTEVDDPRPGPGQVLIDVRAAGINFPDGLIVAGEYQTRPELPFIPGSEVAGTVIGLGPGADGPAVGTRVMAYCRMGGYAEQVAVDTARVFPIPETMDFVDAAGFPITYGTSYHGLIDRAGLRAGERLLVLGAAGGVGLTAVQIGAAAGAHVIAAASTADKLALCRESGAAELIDYGGVDPREALRAAGRVDVVYDPVGGPLAESAIRALDWGGRYLTVGYASGDVPKIGMNRVLIGSGALLGVLWGEWARREPARNTANTARLLDLYDRGLLRPHVGRVLPFTEAVQALETVMGRRAEGKVVLRRD